MRRWAFRLIAGWLAVLSGGGATAQTPDARAVGGRAALPQAADAPRPPVLLVREGEEPSTPLAIESARYEVTILGLVATTRATLVFRNDTTRTYEGELVYPLPEGSVLAGFALDVQGQLVDAVIVEAREARVAFEAEVRKGIDPGLVEWVRGNTFRTRVWPVPARGRRTIRVEYLSELPVRGGQAGGEALYELPLRSAHRSRSCPSAWRSRETTWCLPYGRGRRPSPSRDGRSGSSLKPRSATSCRRT